MLMLVKKICNETGVTRTKNKPSGIHEPQRQLTFRQDWFLNFQQHSYIVTQHGQLHKISRTHIAPVKTGIQILFLLKDFSNMKYNHSK